MSVPTAGDGEGLTVLLCQVDLVWEDKSATFAKVCGLVRAAGPPPGSLIVLPEMFATGFSMNHAAIAEAPRGETEAFLRELAEETKSCVLGGLIAVEDGAPRNQALALAPTGEVLARYSKQRPFSLANEDAHYPAGDETVVFDWAGFRIAPFVCYDLRFPELFRAAVAKGATLFAVIANWPIAREAHWLTLLEARAIENQACVLGVNRSGDDPHFHYGGRSVAVDPHGLIVACRRPRGHRHRENQSRSCGRLARPLPCAARRRAGVMSRNRKPGAARGTRAFLTHHCQCCR
ncbi:MAG: nitrilase-related carbon-nitrogen hydrolase [Verrucomicrobiales bacterium]